MVLIADTAYINGDFARLNLNTYKSRDKDFSGRLLYYTPTGKFMAGWRYEKGIITKSLSVTTESTIKVQSKPQVNVARICFSYPVTTVTATCVKVPGREETDCTYTTITLTECHDVDGGGGSGGGGSGGGGESSGGGDDGGGSTPQPENPCNIVNPASVNGGKIINSVKVRVLPGDGGGFPPPPVPDDPCPPTPEPIILKIDASQLKNNFPCAVKLILDKLMQNSSYANLVAPFNTLQRPSLIWTNII
jgi:hypothetical protein